MKNKYICNCTINWIEFLKDDSGIKVFSFKVRKLNWLVTKWTVNQEYTYSIG